MIYTVVVKYGAHKNLKYTMNMNDMPKINS